MIDTHAHLTERDLFNKLNEIIDNAKKNGVNKIISVGMTKKANQTSIEIANTYENVYASVGIHPNEVENEELNIELLEKQTKNIKVVAVGEIGIDLYRNKDTFDKQRAYFIEQIKLAIRINLPIIVHSRNSAREIYDILKAYPEVKGVMHCYSEHLELVDKFIDLGFYIGVGGIITFKNAHDVREIVNKVPLDKLLIETDSPYLAPVPFRGKENQPAYVKHTLIKLAEIKNMNVKEIKEITINNTYNLFSKMVR